MKLTTIAILFLMALTGFAQSGPDYGTTLTTPYIEANHLTRIINQDLNPQNNSDCTNIEITEDNTSGFYLEHEKAYAGNFSWAHAWWFSNPGAWTVIGLGPVA